MQGRGKSDRSAKPRADVLGVGISAITMEEAVTETLHLIAKGGTGYICVTGVHGIMEAQKDPEFRRILNESFLTTPDGMPTVWIGKRQGFHMERVYGPDFMKALCLTGVERNLRHFLYGGMPGVAEQLKRSLEVQIPGIQVVGTFCPPFRSLFPKEKEELSSLVHSSRPHVIWVGLSTPKQEKFMSESFSWLDSNLLVGVGAAFDILTGRVRDAPSWVKRAGLQWAHRLIQEPSRLWRRYLVNNISFGLALIRQRIFQSS